MTTKIKLSETQKYVIQWMRSDHLLFKHITYVILINSKSRISLATFYALVNKKLITKYKNTWMGVQYILTELGKSIPL